MHYTIIQSIIRWLINAAYKLVGGRTSDPVPVEWHNTFASWRVLLYGTSACTEQGRIIRHQKCVQENIIPLDYIICPPQPSAN